MKTVTAKVEARRLHPKRIDSSRHLETGVCPSTTAFNKLKSIAPELTHGQIVTLFHHFYYTNLGNYTNNWFGTPLQKCPFDLWAFQEIIYETRPDVIIETGTALGGSARFLAGICRLLGKGRVISIDVVKHKERAEPEENLTFVVGSSIDRRTFAKVQRRLHRYEQVMVILDSYHRKDHVLKELALYAPLVTPNCYLVVEDTNIDNRPLEADPNFPGPGQALDEWLPSHPEFQVDYLSEKNYITFNPGGFLRRIYR